MAYTDRQRELRRCEGMTKAGEQCKRPSCWGDRFCPAHGGTLHDMGRRRVRTGYRAWLGHWHAPHKVKADQANYPPCNCGAAPFPHRPTSVPGCTWQGDESLYVDESEVSEDFAVFLRRLCGYDE